MAPTFGAPYQKYQDRPLPVVVPNPKAVMSEQDRDRSVIASFVIKNQCSWSVFSFRTWTNKLNLWYVYCSTVNRKLGYWPLLLRLFIGKANQGGGTCSRSNESRLPPFWNEFYESKHFLALEIWFRWKCEPLEMWKFSIESVVLFAWCMI